MGNGASTGQGGNPAHGRRDVREEADTRQYNWPELAEAPITNQQWRNVKFRAPLQENYSGPPP